MTRVAALLMVLTAVIATGCHSVVVGGGSGVLQGGGSSAPAGPAPAPAAPTAGATAPAGFPGTAGGSGSTAPFPPATAPGGDDNLVTLDGKARSVETTAFVGGLSAVHLSGPSVLTATGDVVDRSGRDLGNGTLRAAGNDIAIAGANLQLGSRVRVQPGQVTVNPGSAGAVTVGLAAGATIAASGITFQPPPPPPSTPPAPAAGPTTTTTVPPPVPIAGPVRLRATSAQLSGANLRWVDAPADLGVAESEADLSWAGSGLITTAHGPIQAAYLGVRAQQLQALLHRAGGEVDVHGTGLALQAYANGVPQLRVPARIDILSTGATTGALGHRRAFVWTPRNLANTYDMAILSIHPGNAAANGVHLGLLPMPPMFGGEPHAMVGGDTAGLKGGSAIDSLIARHGDDKRSIGYDAPPGVALVLVIQGNFDPITVTVTTY